MVKSLYIHIPFCRKRCFYCDFYSRTNLGIKSEYLRALFKEAKAARNIPHRIETIYVGGGTPSILSAGEIDFLFDKVISVWNVSKNAEITFEVNPESADREKLRALKRNGARRISIGFQSLDDRILKRAGRLHTKKEALKSFEDARLAGFENINIDIIYGLPGQRLKTFAETLKQVISLAPEHISAYLYQSNSKSRRLLGKELDGEKSFEMYRHLCETASENGYNHYEISNFAKEHFQCRHNANCWRGLDYIALGAAAVATVGNIRIKNRGVKAYIENPLNKKLEILSDKQKKFEKFFLNLRTQKGVPYRKKFDRYIRESLLEKKGGKVAFTEDGWFVSNAVITNLV